MQALTTLAAADAPAGGAALGQVAIATGFATVVTSVLLWLVLGHRNGTVTVLGRLSALAGRILRMPDWVALPISLATASLVCALYGLQWDVSLHIDRGRDPGPLANPAHYFILVGLFGLFSSGILALTLTPKGAAATRSSVRITRDWHAPIGAILLAAGASFALLGFPLDDIWHRLFGQDVTLWGPTHLMMLSGAGLSVVAIAVLLQEGRRAQARDGVAGSPRWEQTLQRIAASGGLLAAFSIYQDEFDYGVPQFRLVWHVLLLAASAGLALVAARAWVGRGGAIAAVGFFWLIRLAVGAIVSGIWGEAWAHLPLYVGEALCVEAAAFAFDPRRRTLAFGATAGLLVGTVGMATEWWWTQWAMPLPWRAEMLPLAAIVGPVAGVAGGTLGALYYLGLHARLPRPAVARAACGGAFAALLALAVACSMTTGADGLRGRVALTDVPSSGGRAAQATVRFEPASAVPKGASVQAIAWQDGVLVTKPLKRIGDGVYRTRQAVPLHGDWKSGIRVETGTKLLDLGLYEPEDKAIPAAALPAPPRFDRKLIPMQRFMQRERKTDIPTWLWSVALTVVFVLMATYIAVLSLGIARIARRDGESAPDDAATPPAEHSRAPRAVPTPA